MALLSVQDLTVRVGRQALVSALSLEVEPGQILAVIGPNGAGKTTLLRAISGDRTPDSGQVWFNDRPLGDWPLARRALSLAVLTQDNPLSFPFTVEEVVALGRSPHSTGTVIDRRVCREAMDKLDVSHLAERLYPSLSGGEKQRVQLARVMAQIWHDEAGGDRLLLLDEPVAALDLGHQRQLMRAVRAFADSGVGVVMVVHDITLASAYADRVLALDHGRCLAQGAPETVVHRELISRLFGTEVSVLDHPHTGKPVVVTNP